MASLSELSTLVLSSGPFLEKVRAAMLITAYNIKNESVATESHVARLSLVKKWLTDPEAYDNHVARYVFGANNTLTLNEINEMSDADIKAHVDASVNLFIDV